MDSLTLASALNSDPATRRLFGKVCAANELPEYIEQRPALFIVNTDPAHLPGTHWIAMYFDDGPCEYIDSIAEEPQREFETFLSKNSHSGYLVNTRRVQSYESDTCGHFCLYFAYFRSRNIPMDMIVQSFTPYYAYNDCICFKGVWTLIFCNLYMFL